MNNTLNTTSKESVKLGNDDWGFSFLDEKEISAVQEMEKMLQSVTASTESKILKLYGMIMPLLQSLAKNPEKEYIYFPDRGKRINKFIEELEEVIKS